MNSALRNLTTGVIRVTAELALTAGFVLLLFAFYVLVWTNQRTAAAQEDLLSQFRSEAQTSDSDKVKARPGPGDGVAVMHIPRLGKDWEWVVIEGTDEADLRNGPGRFSESAMPGKIGNFAIAGHRATHGEPFAQVDKLVDGDEIVIETAKEWLVYQVAWSQIVPPTATEVIAPVAGYPDQKPTQRTMTLVTCHPRWGSTERLVIGSQLVERRTTAAGPPESIV